MLAEQAVAAPHSPVVLKVAALACRRGERLLFSSIDWELHPGQILALRGPNGAGKTTMLLALAGAFRPQSGTISFKGADPDRPPGTLLALLGHQSGLKDTLTVAENLEFWARLNGADGKIVTALERVGLAPIAGLVAAGLSAGQRRRLALARLIVSQRPVWLLDEPTAALDANGEKLVGALLDEHLTRGGLAVAATHHDLPLAEPARLRTLQLGRAVA